MEIKVSIPALEKLVDYSASGIGSVAGTMFLTWSARQNAKARVITAQGEIDAQRLLTEGRADTMHIIADAQAKARAMLVSPDSKVEGELDFAHTITQRIQFQEEKRQSNIESVVRQTASELEDKRVEDHDPDHDWTARFFSDIQDVSNQETQLLYAKILAGEVERPGSTSIKALSLLRDLDQMTARLFRILCSVSIYTSLNEEHTDVRVLSLGGQATQNALDRFGLSFRNLNVLNEHGLIISDFASWYDLRVSVDIFDANEKREEIFMCVPFRFQDCYWLLKPTKPRSVDAEFRGNGVALTKAGRELARVVACQAVPEYQQQLEVFFASQGMVMTEMESGLPKVIYADSS